MKKVLILIFFFWATSVFSTTNEAIFHNEGINNIPEKFLYRLANMVSSSISTGLLVNGSRTGLGDKSSLMNKTKAQGLYYQGLNIVSLLDQEFMRQIYHENVGPLPEEIGVLTGTFSQKFINSRPPNKSSMIKKLERSFQLLFPEFPKLEVRKMQDSEFKGSVDSPWVGKTYNVLRQAIDSQLAEIHQLTKGPRSMDIVKKLKTLYHAFVPLSIWSYAHLPKKNLRDGFIKASVVLPPFHQLKGDKGEDPKTWFLEKGLKMTKLPKVINISVAKLTHLAYLGTQKDFIKNIIKVDLSKDFRKPNEVETKISFGRLTEGKEGIHVSTGHEQDALVIRFKLHLEVFENDNSMVRSIKNFMNGLGENFIIDARIHQLGLTLKREAKDTTASSTFEKAILSPRFSLEHSKISFRVHRTTSSASEKKALELAFFKCIKKDNEFDCYRDYWTWSMFFEDMENGRLLTLRTNKIQLFTERLLAKAAGAFTKFIINTNIGRIETAIDLEMMEVLEFYMEKFAETRKTINERINKGIFNP